MMPIEKDGGASLKKWHQTRLANLLRLSGEPPKNLCKEELCLTVCIRYAQSLLENPRIKRYVSKHHSGELKRLEKLVTDFEQHR
jgi:CRISPR/Cas system-associated protein Cas7 (RAMP superfamily)